MDELDLVRAFDPVKATVDPRARAAARERLAAHVGHDGAPDGQTSGGARLAVDRGSVGPGAPEPGARGGFEGEQDVYRCLGGCLRDLAADDLVSGQLQRANTIVQFSIRNPTAQITLKLKPGQDIQVDLGPTQLVPEVVMTMDAATAHDFWLGRLNVTVALARGRMKAKGPVANVLKLMPLIKPALARRPSHPAASSAVADR